MICYRLWLIILQPKIDTLFSALFEDFQMGVIQDLVSRLIVNENGISVYQNLSLGVDNQKQIRF